jgi:hypothetical protein
MDDVQLTQREHNIIEQLELVWQFPRDISTETLKHITEMVLRLPEISKVVGLQKLAEYAMSVMNLHILSLLDLFQRQADAEHISSREQKETLVQVIPAIFRLFTSLDRNHLSISSLDDLATLSNIVLSLHTLSQSESADEAQSWLYELPATYQQQLTQEHLLVEPSKIVFTNAVSFTGWSDHVSYLNVAADRSFVNVPATQPGNTILLKQDQDSRSHIA